MFLKSLSIAPPLQGLLQTSPGRLLQSAGWGGDCKYSATLTVPTPVPVEPLGPVRGTGPSTPKGEG
jgi:hypothetical protein